MIKAIVFDFDGVLGDTYKINFDISREFDSNFTEQDFKDHHNGNVFAEPKINFPDGYIPEFAKRQKNIFIKNNLFPLKKELKILSQKYQLFIISSSIDKNIKYFLSLGNYNQYFKKILGASTHKSKIAKFKMLFEEFKLKPHECVFITDTIGDIREAVEIDVLSVAVTWGYHNEETLASSNPTAIARTPKELLTIIATIQQ